MVVPALCARMDCAGYLPARCRRGSIGPAEPAGPPLAAARSA